MNIFKKISIFIKKIYEVRKYNKYLKKYNAKKVWEFNQFPRKKSLDGLTGIEFKDGNIFKLIDQGGTFIFKEIFIDKQYDYKLENIKKPKIILDVGANIGLYTAYINLKYPDATIHAIEASPEAFKVCQKNLNKLNNKNINCYLFAAGSENGKTIIYSSPVSSSSSLYCNRGASNGVPNLIEIKCLSNFLKERDIPEVDILKIDVEGAEYSILIDDKDLLNKFKIKLLIVEIDRIPRAGSKHSFEQLISILNGKFSNVVSYDHDSCKYPVYFCSNN
jgi:FkbM family methyltransferase